jgi:hypothetical protein
MGSGSRLAILTAVVAALTLTERAANAETVYGEAKALGNGFAQLYADLGPDGAPRVLGISFVESMLEGLPAVPNTYSRCFDKNGNGKIDGHGECHGDFELTFPLPIEVAERSKTPFTWVSVNWSPEGHPPPAPPPWAVPHFDFHFYIQDRESVRAIRPGPCSELIDCDDFKRSQMPVPAKYLHPDHIDVGAAVSDMGNHLIDSKSPELAPGGPPFTRTFIYGAYDGHVTFYEPMIARSYLETRPDTCAALKLPQAWEIGGHYPTNYCIRYRDGEGRYTVSLEDFVFRGAD